MSEKEDEDKDEIVIVEKPLEEAGEKKEEQEEQEERRAKVETDEEREAIRERRRQERQERKEKRKRDHIELDFLRKRNEELERRMSSVEAQTMQVNVGHLDAQVTAAAREFEMAEQIIAKALEAGATQDVIAAMRHRDAAVAKYNQLQSQKQQIAQASRQQAPQIDQTILRHASEFKADHSWFDPDGRDEDSAIVQTIDNQLAREGLDPRSDDYWDELRDRIEKRLPHRFERQPKEKPKGPPIGSGREHAPPSTRREVHISPERRKALEEAGVWDDQKLRDRFVKSYEKYDREARATRSNS